MGRTSEALTYMMLMVGGFGGGLFFFLINPFHWEFLLVIFVYELCVVPSIFGIIILKRGYYFRQKDTAIIVDSIDEKDNKGGRAITQIDFFKTEDGFDAPDGHHTVEAESYLFEIGGHRYYKYQKGRQGPVKPPSGTAKGSSEVMKQVNRGIVSKLLIMAGVDPKSIKAQWWMILIGIALGMFMMISLNNIPGVAKNIDPWYNRTIYGAVIMVLLP